MLNQAIVVGVLESIVDGILFLRVERNYRNQSGVYDSDFVQLKLSEFILESTNQYLKEGSMIAAKCRLVQETFDSPLQLVADKVSFL
jgi:hypothetical protein